MEIRATGYRHVLVNMGIDTFDSIKSDVIFDNGAGISFYLSWNLPEGAPALTTQGICLQFERGELKIDTRDRGMYELGRDGYRSLNPMAFHRTSDGVAGYAYESVGEALLEFLELKRTARSNYDELERISPSGRDGFYATLMAQATHESLRGRPNASQGQVYLGATVNINEYGSACRFGTCTAAMSGD